MRGARAVTFLCGLVCAAAVADPPARPTELAALDRLLGTWHCAGTDAAGVLGRVRRGPNEHERTAETGARGARSVDARAACRRAR